MGLEILHSKSVFLDSAPLIYSIEGNPNYSEGLQAFFDAFENGNFTIVTSALTLKEVLVQPLRLKLFDLAEQYKAEIRAKYNLKTQDSIQIATALISGCTHFFTNDIRLKTVAELHVLTPHDI